MAKSRLKSRRRNDQGSKLSRILIGILATVGVIDTGSITLNRWGLIGSLTCPGSNEGCDQVLNSPWGTLFQINTFEIPLSLIGFLSYCTILFLSIIPFLQWSNSKKIDFPTNAWWILFYISICMSVFSLILMGIMFIKIKALCFFCILSATLSIIILILTVVGGGWEEPRDLFFKGVLLSIIVLLGGLIWSSSVDPSKSRESLIQEGIAPIVNTKSSQSSIQLANHLTANNIILYNAYWCPHCHEQKEMFGKEATSKLLLVECASDGKNNKADLCRNKEINAYPSWEINGIIESGVKSLNELANLSNYSGPRDF